MVSHLVQHACQKRLCVMSTHLEEHRSQHGNWARCGTCKTVGDALCIVARLCLLRWSPSRASRQPIDVIWEKSSRSDRIVAVVNGDPVSLGYEGRCCSNHGVADETRSATPLRRVSSLVARTAPLHRQGLGWAASRTYARDNIA